MIRKRRLARVRPRSRALPPLHRGANSRDAAAPTRERILAAAARLFAEHGFERSSMPAIAKASGITAGAIYKHFRSKGELLLEVVKRSFESMPLFVPNPAAGAATTLPQLAAAYTQAELKQVRRLSIEIHSAAGKDSDVRRILKPANAAAMNLVRDAIALAQRAGKLDPRLSADLSARLFGVLVMGLLHMDTLLPELIGDPTWRDFVRERVAALIGVR